MKHAAFKLALSALLLGIIFDALLYHSYDLGLNIFLMQLAVCAVIFALMKHAQMTVDKRTMVAAIFAVLFSGTFVIWTSIPSLMLSMLGLLASNFFFVLYAWGHHGVFSHPLSIAVDGIRYSIETLVTRLGIFGDIRLPKTSDRGSSIIRGCIIALPILLIFFLLFLSSDLMLQTKANAFQEWMNTIFGPLNLIAHISIVIFFSLIFLLIFASMFWKRLNIELPKALTTHSHTESAVILIGSNVLFILFLIFQGYYLFGGQAAFNALENLTYSEYAVAGFHELAIVSVLVLLLILTLRHFHGAHTRSKLLIITEIGLLVETLTLLVSAWMRLSMYVAEYAYTPARLFGFWFFLVAAVLIIWLGTHIILKSKQDLFINHALVFLGCAILIFTALSPDALTMRLNMARAQETGELDPFPLFDQLTAEAYPLMDMVLSSKSYEPVIGIMDTTITDYCPFVEVQYRSEWEGQTRTEYISAFSLMPDDPNLIESQIANDIMVRQGRALFYANWNSEERAQQDWRTWNLARSLVPYTPSNDLGDPLANIPYPIEDIAAACGWHIGDLRQ